MSYLSWLWDSVKFDFLYYLVVFSMIVAYNFYVGLSFLSLVLILCFSSLIRALFKEKRFVLVSFFKTCSLIIVVVAAFWFLPRIIGWWFVWVLLLGFLVYKFWVGRVLLMNSMRFVETRLFGKPLDKKEFKKSEKPSIYKEDKGDEL